MATDLDFLFAGTLNSNILQDFSSDVYNGDKDLSSINIYILDQMNMQKYLM